MQSSQEPSPSLTTVSRVAIVGGGFSGATISRLLALSGLFEPDEIVVFEPRSRLGAGVAYDTNDPSLRLNVAAHRMRAIPGDPQRFARWFCETGRAGRDPEAGTEGAIYARRGDFADFMDNEMRPLLENGSIIHACERVERIHRQNGRWRIEGNAGTILHADIVVVATGHPPPRTPAQFASALQFHPRFVSNPSTSGAFQKIQQRDNIWIIGAGLTALDVLATLRARGHSGEITLLSRSGRLPRPHATGSFTLDGDDLLKRVPKTALCLLRQVRLAISDVTEKRLPWQIVFDALRHQGQAIWQALPLEEQRCFLRHLRRWYDIHRFRMPPQIKELVARETAAGRLHIRAGRIVSAECGSRDILVDVATTPHGNIEKDRAQWLILATGPDHENVIGSQACLLDLERAALITKDPHGLGIKCDRENRALARDGTPVDDLFIAGPLARGTFGELTSVPEIVDQAERIMQRIRQIRSIGTRRTPIRSTLNN
ncbi:FAD/NAD(P)-binding protein [Rhizobium sp. CCGE531]|uniref:FAD/NAD(P)-binding protein n=1 Tax=Rhizobium sp. CCGE531 TaxID=2364271 RepID=UPI000EAAB7DA|nr:FAD/NAD(P)-binding protein [Rhizobium sp. CCGE531]AYG70670.1 hydroxyacylglutathione hydrolase [Rhizobium sp. CCGE531]